MNAFLKNKLSALNAQIRRALWLATIKNLRKLVDVADDWTHTQEIALREQSTTAVAEKATALEAVDQKASAQREKVILRDRRNQTNRKAARPRRARLVYQAGAFVRMEQ